MAAITHIPPLRASFASKSSKSPTATIFMDPQSSVDDIRHWTESKVGEWLASVNCGKYTRLFEENHINGEALLEVDQDVVRELGVTKVGDRVRLFVAIKSLRTKAYSTGKTKTEINSAATSPALIPDSPSDASSTHRPSMATIATTQPATAVKYQQLGTSRSVSGSSITTTQPEKQNLVKFIFQLGHTKTVDINGCFNAESIIKKGIRKLGCKDSADTWSVFVTTDSGGGGGVRKVEDIELVAICHTPDRPERERLILVPVGGVPTNEEFQKSIQIAREQLSREVTQRPGAFTDLNELQRQTVPRLPPPPPSQFRRQPDDSNHDKAVGSTDLSARKQMRNFFGQRPPSELISSNLAEYFPGHESRVLEQTVRNSIRHSKRISGMSRRMSVATTESFGSSNRESLPPVPSFGDGWIGPSNRRSVLSISSPPSRTSSTFRRIRRSTNSVSSSILVDDDDTKQSPIEAPEEDPYARQHLPTRPFSVFSKAETINSVMSDNNSYIEVDNVEDIPEEMSDAEYDADEIDGGPTRWIKGALIGSGSFGSVLLGLNALTGELMAVKQVGLTQNDKQGGDQARRKPMIDALQREIQLLRDLHHENIVQYLGSNSDGQYLNIFLEYVPGGSVAALLRNYGPFEEPLIRTFVRQILTGLNYLHQKDIIHRDIKGANVLVDNKGKIKISDFGISKRVEAGLLSGNQHHRPSLQGSVYWMAPEVVKQTSYTRKADIWSVGCLVVEMFTGTHPFPEFSQMQALFKIGTMCAPEVPKEISSDAKDFLAKTFEFDFEKRPSAQELLLHAFLNSPERPQE
ncbi:kinase-like domain-containing protein [Lipomyces arxii]|uniref:kinase-like domain-containing protein n=1 Tax=Lipomyces arxii TaxID=56418 RepID=UPI0034CE1AB3